MRSSSSDNRMKNAAKNFQKIRWRSAAFLLAENAVFLLTVYTLSVTTPITIAKVVIFTRSFSFTMLFLAGI